MGGLFLFRDAGEGGVVFVFYNKKLATRLAVTVHTNATAENACVQCKTDFCEKIKTHYSFNETKKKQ